MPRPAIEPDEKRLQRLRESARTVEIAKRDLAKAETARDRLMVDAIGHANQEAISEAAGVSTATLWRAVRKAREAK